MPLSSTRESHRMTKRISHMETLIFPSLKESKGLLYHIKKKETKPPSGRCSG